MKIFRFMLVAALSVMMLTSCNHKDLDYYTDAGNVRVVFDWRNAPDAAPASMEAYFYSVDAPAAPVRFGFVGRDGGTVHISDGSYSVIGVNSDIADWARFRNLESVETFEVITTDAESLEAFSLAANSLPRARAAESERMARTPQTLYGDRGDGVTLRVTDTEQTVTLYPREVTAHYTVTVTDVKNIRNLSDGSLDATLSGMAEGFSHGKMTPTDTPVTMPFTLSANSDAQTLEGKFLTFGECPHASVPHLLVVYMVFADGSRRYQTFDVSEQVYRAPDPMNVHIIVSGLDIPQRIDAGGGFRPDVDEWVETDVPLKM